MRPGSPKRVVPGTTKFLRTPRYRSCPARFHPRRPARKLHHRTPAREFGPQPHTNASSYHSHANVSHERAHIASQSAPTRLGSSPPGTDASPPGRPTKSLIAGKRTPSKRTLSQVVHAGGGSAAKVAPRSGLRHIKAIGCEICEMLVLTMAAHHGQRDGATRGIAPTSCWCA